MDDRSAEMAWLEALWSIHEELALLVHSMLAKAPAARPSMSEVVVSLEQHFGRPTEQVRLCSLAASDEHGEGAPIGHGGEAEDTAVSRCLDGSVNQSEPREPAPLSGQIQERAKDQGLAADVDRCRDT